MISFIKWLEEVAAAPAPAASASSSATTTSSISGSPGATTSGDISPFLRPVGSDIVKRQYPDIKRKKHRRKNLRKH